VFTCLKYKLNLPRTIFTFNPSQRDGFSFIMNEMSFLNNGLNVLTLKYTAMYIVNAECPDGND